MRRLLAITLGVALAGIGTATLAARNSSGTYSLPSTWNPVTTGTKITTTWANGTLGDLATELTDSLSRSGKGGMLAPLRSIDGTSASPALSFTNETTTGWYRAAAGDIRFCRASTDQVRITSGVSAATFTFTSPQAAGGAQTDFLWNSSATRTAGTLFDFQNNGTSILKYDVAGNEIAPGAPIASRVANGSLTLRGNKDAADTGTDVIVSSKATRTGTGALFAVQNNGTDKFKLDVNGEPMIGGGLAMGIGVKSDADQVDTSGVADVPIAGMSFPVLANGVYVWEAWGGCGVAGGGSGIAFGVSGPAAPTDVNYSFSLWYSTNAQTLQNAQAFGMFGTPTVVTSVTLTKMTGYLVNGANAGTVAINFKWNGAGTSATVKKGWFLRWRRIA